MSSPSIALLSRALRLAVATVLAAVPLHAAEPQNWVGTWACSPQLVEPQNLPPAPGLAGNTLRQIVHVTLGGQQIRLRLSNEFGATPLTVIGVHVALPAIAGGIRPETDRAVTFGGKPAITLPAGSLMFSDPLAFAVAPVSDLAVSIQAQSIPEGLTGHPGSRATSYLAPGDQLAAATLTDAATTDHWYLLDGLDVLAAKGSAAIVTLGDSITDGRGSITNQNTRWPDDLARALAAEKKTANISVLNQGIGGNRVLRDGIGPGALSRYDRDVLAQTGAQWVVVLEGVNDIGTYKASGPSPIADDLILAFQQFILRAHTHGLKIIGATITPFANSFYSTPDTEADRHRVNDWIRTSGQFDAVADFDKAVRDPQSPDQLDPVTDSGDHLHPNSEGYKRMAAAIDHRLFEH